MYKDDRCIERILQSRILQSREKDVQKQIEKNKIRGMQNIIKSIK